MMQPNQPFQPYPTQPGMPVDPGLQSHNSKKKHAWGLIILLVLTILLFLGASAFGLWAYMSRADYKNNTDKITAKAVELAVQAESTRKDKEFVESEKRPLKEYKGPDTFGSVKISYPKTWSAYVTETDKGAITVDGYFHPGFVPDVRGATLFALRIQVVSQAYEQELSQFESRVKTGKVKVSSFSAKNVSGTVGSRIDGELETGQQGSMILLPLRDKTLKVYTQSQQFIGDFNKIILENLSFVP